jgi:hypothetical protein
VVSSWRIRAYISGIQSCEGNLTSGIEEVKVTKLTLLHAALLLHQKRRGFPIVHPINGLALLQISQTRGTLAVLDFLFTRDFKRRGGTSGAIS